MRLDPTELSSIKVGMIVEILDLDDKITEGEITHIISKYDNVEGIIVKLKNNHKGNIKKIIKTTIEHKTESLTKEFILLPESFNLEYKRNFKPLTYDKDKTWIPSFTVYKTIAGFANSEGGKLVIGVEDEKNKPLKITGLGHDFEYISKLSLGKTEQYSKDQDGMELRLVHEFDHYFLKQPLVRNLVKIKFFGTDPKKMICTLDVKRSYEAVIMYDDDPRTPPQKKGPNFFVRVNNQTMPYAPSDFIRYWVQHITQLYGRDQLPVP